MDAQSAIDLAREALWTTLFVASPVLIAALVVGLVIGLLQALTQIQEQSVAFVPKIDRHALGAEHFAAVADLPNDALHHRVDRRHPRRILDRDAWRSARSTCSGR